MRVKELIQKLSKLDPELEVVSRQSDGRYSETWMTSGEMDRADMAGNTLKWPESRYPDYRRKVVALSAKGGPWND